MRLKLSFLPLNEMGEWRENKHAVQGFIYAMLKDSEYGLRHDEKRFKFFTFSDIFRDSKGLYTLLISSPDRGFIETIYQNVKDRETIYIGKDEFRLIEVKKFRLKLKRAFQTGSPVVIYKDSTEAEEEREA
ncbi:hypothetical protein [Thermococcus chitonophagus]|uniref:hypothetical protein n=1 Tax=Thermococcus chitonophagus TaxID=54262 RepID=UPI00269E8328